MCVSDVLQHHMSISNRGVIKPTINYYGKNTLKTEVSWTYMNVLTMDNIKDQHFLDNRMTLSIFF